jgi:hypothetical protein
VAKVLLTVLLQALLELGTLSRFTFGYPRSDVLALVVVDVSSNFEVEVCLTGCRRDAVGTRVGFSRSNSAVWCGLMRLQTTRSVCCDAEVTSKRWADI